MASALELVSRAYASRRGEESRYAIDQWISDYLIPSTFSYGGSQFSYGGPNGLITTYGAGKVLEITRTLPGYLAALRACPPAFAAQMVRALVLSGVRFTFRNRPSTSTPRRQFGTRALDRLERPWPKATTGQMVSMMEWHAGLAGNAYVLQQPDRLRVLRPDYVGVLYGSDQQPEDAAHALDGTLIGYVYQNGGLFSSGYKPQTLLPDEVAHWCPMPDPECAGIGMSWLTPALRDIQADSAATEHKIAYFRNGATPNMVVKGLQAATKEQFNQLVDMLEERHAGVANAYRTLYLTTGADATVVGSNLAELDLKNVQGAGETRISMLSRVPATIMQIAEGLAGSSLNAGNFSAARRTWADSWIYPTLADLSAALADVVQVPADAELWTDVADMPILREDAKDAAEIAQINAQTIVQLVNGGWEPESVKVAVLGQDMSLLKHSGLLSVQLQPPGQGPPAAGGADPKAGPGPSRSGGGTERKFNPAEPRDPHSGEWSKVGAAVEHVTEDITKAFDGAVTGDEAHAAVAFDSSGMAWSHQVDRAIADYGGEGPSSYQSVNDGLRGSGHFVGPEGMTAGQKLTVAGLDAAMARSPGAPRDMIVHRFIDSPEHVFGGKAADYEGAEPRSLTGLKWRDKGFVSTASSEWDTAGLKMRILVPKGTKAISHPDLDLDEILLNRGLTFRVVADYGKASPSIVSPHRIDVEVISE